MPPPRILVTRAPHQASALAEALTAAGLQTVLIPAIEMADPTTFKPLDEALASLDSFDWIIFTSANAVEAFHRRLAGRDVPHLRIAAIGPSTARALEAIQLRAALVPTQAIAESLAEALVPLALQASGTPARFLIIRAEQARDIVPDALRAAGADVTIAPAYRTVIPRQSLAEVQTLFSDERSYPAAITFTSSSTALNLLALLDAANLDLPPSVLRVSIGPITSQTLRDHGLPPHAEAAEANISSLAAAVLEALEHRNSG